MARAEPDGPVEIAEVLGEQAGIGRASCHAIHVRDKPRLALPDESHVMPCAGRERTAVRDDPAACIVYLEVDFEDVAAVEDEAELAIVPRIFPAQDFPRGAARLPEPQADADRVRAVGIQDLLREFDAVIGAIEASRRADVPGLAGGGAARPTARAVAAAVHRVSEDQHAVGARHVIQGQVVSRRRPGGGGRLVVEGRAGHLGAEGDLGLAEPGDGVVCSAGGGIGGEGGAALAPRPTGHLLVADCGLAAGPTGHADLALGALVHQVAPTVGVRRRAVRTRGDAQQGHVVATYLDPHLVAGSIGSGPRYGQRHGAVGGVARQVGGDRDPRRGDGRLVQVDDGGGGVYVDAPLQRRRVAGYLVVRQARQRGHVVGCFDGDGVMPVRLRFGQDVIHRPGVA